MYSNRRRGMDAKAARPRPQMLDSPSAASPPSQPTLIILPPPSPKSARAMRPRWRDLIMKVWGEDPLLCPCCKGTMKSAGTIIRRGEVEFFLRLHGLWLGAIDLPPPPDPPFDIETMEPLDVPPEWGWDPDTWEAPELALGDGQVLVLDADDPFPKDQSPVYQAN
jgi:hypothetical protein